MNEPWFTHRLGPIGQLLDAFKLGGYNGLFAEGHPLPHGVKLEGDPSMPELTTTRNRAFLKWQHDALLWLPPGTKGYLAFLLGGEPDWHVRTRELITFENTVMVDAMHFASFRMHRSRQTTWVAVVDENGIEIEELRLIEGNFRPTSDLRAAHIPLY